MFILTDKDFSVDDGEFDSPPVVEYNLVDTMEELPFNVCGTCTKNISAIAVQVSEHIRASALKKQNETGHGMSKTDYEKARNDALYDIAPMWVLPRNCCRGSVLEQMIVKNRPKFNKRHIEGMVHEEDIKQSQAAAAKRITVINKPAIDKSIEKQSKKLKNEHANIKKGKEIVEFNNVEVVTYDRAASAHLFDDPVGNIAIRRVDPTLSRKQLTYNPYMTRLDNYFPTDIPEREGLPKPKPLPPANFESDFFPSLPPIDDTFKEEIVDVHAGVDRSMYVYGQGKTGIKGLETLIVKGRTVIAR
jgi:hypothetical protein